MRSVSRLASFLLCTITVVFALVFALSVTAPPSKEEYEAALERELWALANKERAARNILPLRWNTDLLQSARRHTDLLARYDLLSHQFKGEPPLLKRIAATGLRFNASAENVALATDFADLHRGWMESEGHRANLLNPKYNVAGIGVVRRNGRLYATQNFARLTEDLSSNAAEERIEKIFNRARQDRGFSPVKIVTSRSIRQAMCEMAKRDDLSARSVPPEKGAHGTIAFTAHDLSALPGSLEKLLSRSDLDRLSIGVCFMATKTYPGGTYWFGISH